MHAASSARSTTTTYSRPTVFDGRHISRMNARDKELPQYHQLAVRTTTRVCTTIWRAQEDFRIEARYRTFLFLGKRLQLHEDNSIRISLEPSYYETIVCPYNLNNNKVKPATTTCLEQQPLESRDKLDPQQHIQYRTTVGRLICASLDRPDLVFAANYIAADYQCQQHKISRV